MTLEEAFGDSKGRTLCFVGDGRNNVARSLMVVCAKLGINFTVVTPASLFPDAAIRDSCAPFASASGARITVTDDLAAVAGADAIYTDVWVSMGEESVRAERQALLANYRVDAALMEKTGRSDSIFLHCLPAGEGEEVTAEVIDGNGAAPGTRPRTASTRSRRSCSPRSASLALTSFGRSSVPDFPR
jgi:ornithine carbamoyltransferase